MVEIVAERGYRAVTARELSRRSGVSSRAFYEHFESKEDCFLRTHALVVRRAAKRVIAAQAGEQEWKEQLRLGFRAFADEIEQEPQAARLALIEAYAAGPAALEQARRAEYTFEAMIGESFARAPDGIEVPSPIVEGIVAGVISVTRALLLAGRSEVSELGDELLEWALSYRSESFSVLRELKTGSTSVNLALKSPSFKSSAEGAWPRSSACDRDLILSAVAKLVTTEGYGQLTASRIHAAAGVPRRSFYSHFEGVEDCFLATVEWRANQAFAHAGLARSDHDGGPRDVYRALAALCARIAKDTVLASLCFENIFAPGTSGLRCNKRLQGRLADLVRDSAPDAQLSNELAIEASAGAAWGILHRCVVSGRAQQLPKIASILSFLALAPLIGAQATIEPLAQAQRGYPSLFRGSVDHGQATQTGVAG